MGDILSKLGQVCDKIGVTERAHTIEEQIDLITEALDATPASTNIAEALDDLSDVAQNINNEEVYVDKTITENGTYLPAEDEATAYSKVVVDVAAPTPETFEIDIDLDMYIAEPTYTSTKTYEEAVSAINSGKRIVFNVVIGDVPTATIDTISYGYSGTRGIFILLSIATTGQPPETFVILWNGDLHTLASLAVSGAILQ